MAIVLGNRAKMSTSTTGTGTITLGSALSGYQTFAQAGITNGQTVRYTIEDGTNFEIGSGVFTSSGTTLTRSVTESSNSDNAITLSGSAEVFITASAADIFVNDGATSLTTTGVGTFASLDISGDVDVDGTLEADAITVNGTALATVIAGTTVTNATNSAHVLVTDNESTNEENLIAFVEGATSSTGNVGLEMDGNFTYNPSTGTVSATVFKGNIDAVDGDFDGTLEADAITLNGTAVTATATLDTGISNNNVPKFTSGVADNDFLRVDGTAIEGRSSSEVLSDIAAAPAAGSSNIVTTGALNSGSITSGFGAINNGASNITTTGVGTFASLDISGDIDVDGTTNLDAVDIDGAVNIAADLTIASTNKILFNDASQFIQGSSATVLSIAATDEIDLTATTIDINGAVALNGAITGATNVTLSGELDAATGDFATSIAVANVGISTGVIDLKNGGSQSVVKFYCESSNAHYAQIQAPAHGSFSGDVTLTLPATTDTIAGIAATQTFTNKTLTSPKINEDVAVTTTATEINLIDGGTSRGTTAVASGDGILINDAGTMRMTNVDTVSTYFSGHSVGGGNIVTTGALNSGSITSGFGAIDNGSSNITTTGVGTFASLDISGNIDVDGTTNLDAVDIDGAVQLDATLTVGVDDTGYDVKFFGDTASAFMQWDASADDLILGGAAGLIVPDGKLTLGSTAVTSTGAELNILDGVTSNATEINILDAITRGSIIYGNSSGATARLAAGDADQVLTSDGTDISWADGGGGGTTIPSGTLMLFNQTAAPTGFTKVTTHNDKALRITSGTVGTGGSVAFETAFASQAVSVAATTIATSTMPSHNHSYNLYGLIAAVTNKIGSSSAGYGATNVVTSTGGGGSHTHTGTAIDLDVAYVDVIIASKD